MAIAHGRIAAIEDNKAGAMETIDASGKWVVPGLIDIHAHLPQPLGFAAMHLPLQVS